MNSRIKNIYLKLEQEGLDGLIVSLPANISYLTEFASRDAYLLVSKPGNFYFTDSRYTEEAKSHIKNIARIKKVNGSVFKIIAQTLSNLGLKRVGFEERYLPFAEHKKIEEELKGSADLIPTHSWIEELRQVKTREEIGKIRKATQITALALQFAKKIISPGKKEIEIAAELERFIRVKGAQGNAFDIIIAAGENSAFPHHKTSQRKIKNNEPVLVDIGVDYYGYKSDLTRVFFLGKITSTFKRTYDTVLKAQQQAFEAIRPGVSIDKVDRAARQYISQKGFGRFFGHGLGHGIGLEVHEEPHISSKNTHRLTKAMVFTVEPAIYLPGRFGIRIEDVVLVTQGGIKVLSGNLDKST
ncbi:MAG: Xaa-Pro peptidase family protein [Candidatus Omnitrophota bacterium]|nr:Xaa-Pro peptidase family protein [Candidatus Omnitrophota bacterium]